VILKIGDLGFLTFCPMGDFLKRIEKMKSCSRTILSEVEVSCFLRDEDLPFVINYQYVQGENYAKTKKK
jgi:hypothetical protein